MVFLAADDLGGGLFDDVVIPVIFLGTAFVAGYLVAAEAAEAGEGSITVDDLVNGSTPIPGSRMGENERKREGGEEQRQKDFDGLAGTLIAGGTVKILTDGTRAVLHGSSTRPGELSLDIQNVSGKKSLKKFRY
jgi:hypothetical protein